MSKICPNGHTSEATDYCDTCGADLAAAPDASPAPTPAPVGAAGSSGQSSAPAPATQVCPNCSVESSPDSLFCEACGYDFTTGAMPRGVPSAAQPASATAPEAAPEAGLGSTPGAPGAPGESAEVGGVGAAPLPVPTPTQGTGIPPAVAPEWVAEVWVDPEWYAGQEADEPMPSPGLPVVVPLTVRSALIGRVSASKNIVPDIDCTTDSGVSRRHAQLTTDGTRWFVEDLGSSNGTFVGQIAAPLPEDPIEVGPKRELDDGDRIYVGAWTRIVVRRATADEQAAAAS
ncbi:MAG: FHA domain-containing protein [Actinomycetales bacterium]|nr:FHA domain-containing protein [Actinomycetales bacterium]